MFTLPAVKVQRVSVGSGARGTWQVTPTPVAELPVIVPKPKPVPTPPKLPAPKPAPPSPPPPPAPPVQLGTAIKPAFDYCPYQYYGKIMTLQRTLCQDSWRQWYSKQWGNGSVNNQAFKAYNLALQEGAGAVAYLRDNKRGTQILAEGFAGLDAIQGRNLLNYAAGTPQVPVNPANQQAWQLLDQVDKQSLNRWFEALLQAHKVGQFDQQYDQLIASEPGFADYQNRMQQLLQIAFQDVAQQQIDLKALTKDFIAWASSLPFDLFSEPPQITCCAPNPFATQGEIPWNINDVLLMGFLIERATQLQGAEGHLNYGQQLQDAIRLAVIALNGSSLLTPEDGGKISEQLLMGLAAIIKNVSDRNLLPQFLGFKICLEACAYPIPVNNPTRLIDLLNKIASQCNS